MTNISLPHSGQIRVNLACVCNVKLAHSGRVLTGANMGPSVQIGSLASISITGLQSAIRDSCRIRNSLHQLRDVGVGQLVSVNSCQNHHRQTKLPIQNRHAQAGSQAHHNNAHHAMTNGGGTPEGWISDFDFNLATLGHLL